MSSAPAYLERDRYFEAVGDSPDGHLHEAPTCSATPACVYNNQLLDDTCVCAHSLATLALQHFYGAVGDTCDILVPLDRVTIPPD
jgi:hypothetical protein